jgi:hypothetical protein
MSNFDKCQHKLRGVRISPLTDIYDVLPHVHCYVLCNWSQSIHGLSPVECNDNPFVTIDEILHITIDDLICIQL